MKLFLLVLSIIILFLAHYIKILRMKRIIEVYESPNENNLLRALSLSYFINYVIPIKVVGELFRAVYQGKHMKNGISFGLATVIVDRLLDIFMIVIIFMLFYFIGFKNSIITSSIVFYSILGIIIIIFLILSVSNLKKYIKKFIKSFACIFNSDIELKILKISWFVISSFKDLINKISKKTIIVYTLLMWCLYLTSYIVFALALQRFGENTNVIDVFTNLFSNNNLIISSKELSINSILLPIYILASTFMLFIFSFIPPKKSNKKEYLKLLPQANFSDRLIFLEGYFSSNSREYFENYIKINRDVSIIKDHSAGSNATTMLCTKDNKTFYRKYTIGTDSEKLYEQILWIKNHEKNIPLTKIDNVKKEEGYCLYDMPYLRESISFFEYMHTVPTNKSWKLLEKILIKINKDLHTLNERNADEKTVKKYITTKVTKNLDKIKNGKYIKPLLKYDYLIINGKKYHNLNFFNKYLSEKYLKEIFMKDKYSEIHGDFTIENIIAIPSKEDYYIIDPNIGNLHNSPNLDYAKLLQSLHGGYEFLMSTQNITIIENKISYICSNSKIYDEIYQKYDKYLFKKYDYLKMKSIYYHEIIHWIRLLPYKIDKNGVRSVLFYCGLILVLNDVYERFEKNEEISNI